MKTTLKSIVLLGAFFCALSPTFSRAASIAWQPVFPVAGLGTAAVFTEGTLHSAVNATTSGVTHTLTVPGIEDIPFAPVGNLFGSTTGDDNFGGSVGEATFDIILNSHSWQGGGASFSINDLVPGNTYSLQLFGVYDTRGCCAARDTQYGDGLGNRSDNVTRGEGETILGFFVADSASQLIEVLPTDNGDGTDPSLSAYIVRDLTPVPEPGTIGLLFMGSLGLVLRNRRRS